MLLVVLLAHGFVGCEIPQITRPLRLNDLKDGTTIEVFVKQESKNNGRFISANAANETFRGESVVSDRQQYWTGSQGIAQSSTQLDSKDYTGFAEAYGFGKENAAKPAGTGILIGSKGTVIEIVFYRISSDLSGDGVAKDNRGKFYRVFLSVEG